jgi:predicted HTH transcriptional regulator
MEDEVVKTVAAFLNADGGSLLVGVSDSGDFPGIDRDLKLFRKDLDLFERWVRGSLLATRIDKQLVANHVVTTVVQVRGKSILQLEVTPSSEPAWVDDRTLYIRNGNQSMELTSGRDLARFLATRAGGSAQ